MSLFLQGISNPRNHLTANALYGKQRTRGFNAGVRALLGDAYKGERLKRSKGKQNTFKGRPRDMPANSTKYKVDPNPLDLEAQNPHMQPQAHDEAKEVRRYVKKRILMLDERIANGGGNAEKVKLWKREKASWQSWLSQLHHKEVLPSVRGEFIQDFQNWLMGRGREVDHLRTAWYRTPIKEKSVENYLGAFINERHRFLAALAILKQRAPRNVDEAYLYYKYIARQNPEEIPIKTFLSDWDKFSVLMDSEWEEEEKPRDVEVNVPKQFPGTMKRSSSGKYHAAVNEHSKVGPKATIPFLVQNGNRTDIKIPGVTPMDKAETARIKAQQQATVDLIEQDLDTYKLQNSEVSKWGKYSSLGGIGRGVGVVNRPALIQHDPPNDGDPGPDPNGDQGDDEDSNDFFVNYRGIGPVTSTPQASFDNPDFYSAPGKTSDKGEEPNNKIKEEPPDDDFESNVVHKPQEEDTESFAKHKRFAKLHKRWTSLLRKNENLDLETKHKWLDKAAYDEKVAIENGIGKWRKRITEAGKNDLDQMSKLQRIAQNEIENVSRNVSREVARDPERGHIIQQLYEENAFNETADKLKSHDLNTEEGKLEREQFLAYAKAEEGIFDEDGEDHANFLKAFQTALTEAEVADNENELFENLAAKWRSAYSSHIFELAEFYNPQEPDYQVAPSTLHPTLDPAEYERLERENKELQELLSSKHHQLEDLQLKAEERENAYRELEKIGKQQSESLRKLKLNLDQQAAQLDLEQIRAAQYEKGLKKVAADLRQAQTKKEKAEIESRAKEEIIEHQKFLLAQATQQKEALAKRLEAATDAQDNLLKQIDGFKGTEEEKRKLEADYFKAELSKTRLRQQLARVTQNAEESAAQAEEAGNRIEAVEQLLKQQIHASTIYKESLEQSQRELQYEREQKIALAQGYEAKQAEAFQLQSDWHKLRDEGQGIINWLTGELNITREAKQSLEQNLYALAQKKVETERILGQALETYDQKVKQLENFGNALLHQRDAHRQIHEAEVNELKSQYEAQILAAKEAFELELQYAQQNWLEEEESANKLSAENAEQILALEKERLRLHEVVNQVVDIKEIEKYNQKQQYQAALEALTAHINILQENQESYKRQAEEAGIQYQEMVRIAAQNRQQGQEGVIAVTQYYETELSHYKKSLAAANAAFGTLKETSVSLESAKVSLLEVLKKPGGKAKVERLLQELVGDNQIISLQANKAAREGQATALFHRHTQPIVQKAESMITDAEENQEQIEALQQTAEEFRPTVPPQFLSEDREKGKEKEKKVSFAPLSLTQRQWQQNRSRSKGTS